MKKIKISASFLGNGDFMPDPGTIDNSKSTTSPAAVFISTLFLARDLSHRAHLRTKSFAAHKALDDFYNAIVGLADSFAEAYQGMYGIMDIPFTAPSSGNNIDIEIISILESQLDYINASRGSFTDYSPLQNIVDEICTLYLSTLYKLKYLK
jgi:hypothetical protein